MILVILFLFLNPILAEDLPILRFSATENVNLYESLRESLKSVWNCQHKISTYKVNGGFPPMARMEGTFIVHQVKVRDIIALPE